MWFPLSLSMHNHPSDSTRSHLKMSNLTLALFVLYSHLINSQIHSPYYLHLSLPFSTTAQSFVGLQWFKQNWWTSTNQVLSWVTLKDDSLRCWLWSINWQRSVGVGLLAMWAFNQTVVQTRNCIQGAIPYIVSHSKCNSPGHNLVLAVWFSRIL